MAINTQLKSLKSRRDRLKTKVTLLSGGYADRKAFPKGEITIFPWENTTNEWLADRVRKKHPEHILYETVERLCDLNGCSIDRFFLGEINLILLVSRALRHEGYVAFSPECPSCGYQEESRIKIPEELERVGEKGKDWPGYDEITLPVCGDVVQIRPLRVEDEKAVTIRQKEAEKENKPFSITAWHKALSIVSVGGGAPDSYDETLQWLDALPTADEDYLTDAMDENTPHLEQVLRHKCDKCGYEFSHRLNFDVDFFR